MIRLTGEQIERLELFLRRMNARNPGMNVSRADAIRVIIEHGLRSVENDEVR